MVLWFLLCAHASSAKPLLFLSTDADPRTALATTQTSSLSSLSSCNLHTAGFAARTQSLLDLRDSFCLILNQGEKELSKQASQLAALKTRGRRRRRPGKGPETGETRPLARVRRRTDPPRATQLHALSRHRCVSAVDERINTRLHQANEDGKQQMPPRLCCDP